MWQGRVDSHGRMLTRELVCDIQSSPPQLEVSGVPDNRRKAEATFYGMAMGQLPPLRLCCKLSCFILLPVKLLYPLIVVVNCNTEHLLCALLTNDELIQMLLQGLGCDSGCAHYAGTTQWSTGWLARLVYPREALA